MLNDSINRFLGILCYPITSLDYLKKDLLEEYFKVDKKNHKETKKIIEEIKKNVIQYIRQNYSIYSYDEIYLYLEKCYLYDADKYKDSFECYYDVLSSLAKSLISQRNGRLVFKYWENENDKNLLGGFAQKNKVFLFHSINRHIPLDIISITYLLQNDVTDTTYLHGFYGQIIVSDLQLDNVLEKGVSENHLHSGVSRSFLSIWESLLEPFTKKSKKGFKNLDLSNNYNYDSDELIFYILSSGILRVYISTKIKNGDDCDLDTYNYEPYKELIDAFLNDRGMKELYEKICIEDNKDDIYNYFMEKWNSILDHSSEYKFGENIIFNIFQESVDLKTSGENIFLFNTLKHIKDNPNNCYCIKKLFIQYIRIKNCIFNIMVQQKTVKGLDYFQMQHYKKNSTMNRINNEKFWENAMREQFQDKNLRKIEFRCSIDKNLSSFRKDIVSFLKSYYNILINDYCIKEDDKYIPYKTFPQVGLVYHLLKREDKTSPHKCFIDGKSDAEKLQFKDIQDDYEILIENLKTLRNENSELSKYIVGLDAASLESSTPVWVFSKIYESARDSSQEPLLTKNNMNMMDNFQSMGFTFHAGEDYRHILSGLRRIDEAVEHLKFHAGDRIGHGSALGISLENWRVHNRTIIIPRIEALENYLWSYNILSQNYGDLKASIIAYLEKRIYDLSKSIYKNTEGLTTSVLIEGYLNLFKNNYDNMCKDFDLDSFCDGVREYKDVSWNSRKLFMARHCKYYLYKMKEPIHFETTDQDMEIAKELQKIVKMNINKAGIIVEINPSSNIVLGDMDTLRDNHIYDLNNSTYNINNVIVCVNSDDPTIFNTNVSNELAYIYYGLLESNVSKENALGWIDKLRVNGVDNSFIKRQESDKQILEKLKQLISDM